jgi:hypothetical protein
MEELENVYEQGLFSDLNKMQSSLLDDLKEYELGILAGILSINRWNKIRCLEISLQSEISEIEKANLIDEKLETLKSHKSVLEELICSIDEHLSIELEESSKMITYDCGGLSLKLM